jgi:hypothetical protein
MQKMGTVLDYNDIKSKCLDSIYQQLTYTYCHSNTNSAQWQVALYDSKGNFKTVDPPRAGVILTCVLKRGTATLVSSELDDEIRV